jgi:hypothetical protein
MLLLSSSNIRPSTFRTSSTPNFWIAQAIGAIFLSPPDLIERWLPMMAPFPATLNGYQHRRIVNNIINDCWTDDEKDNEENNNYGFELLEPSDEWIVDNQIHNQDQQILINRIDQENDFDGNKNTRRNTAATTKKNDSSNLFSNYFLSLHLLFSLPSSMNDEEQDGNDNDNDTSMMIGSMKPSTYGEITPLGARQLFDAMGLLDYNKNININNRKSQHSNPHADTDTDTDTDTDDGNGAHFYDLGSGTGKLVAQAVLELSSPLLKGRTLLKKATGIELSPSRHKSAIQSKQNTLNALCNNKELKFSSSLSSSLSGQQYEYIYNDAASSIISNKLELIQGDLFDIDLSTATHIYIASLCFPDNLMLKLEERLMTLITSVSQQQQQQQQQQQDHDEEDDDNDNDNDNGEKDDIITPPAVKRSRTKQQQKQQQLQCIATLRKFPNDLGGIKPSIRYMEMSWTSPLGSAVYLYHVSDRAVV